MVTSDIEASVDAALAQYGGVPAVMTSLDRVCNLRGARDRRAGLIAYAQTRGAAANFTRLVERIRDDCRAVEEAGPGIGPLTARAMADEIFQLLDTPFRRHHLRKLCAMSTIKLGAPPNEWDGIRDQLAAYIELRGLNLLNTAENLLVLAQ